MILRLLDLALSLTPEMQLSNLLVMTLNLIMITKPITTIVVSQKEFCLITIAVMPLKIIVFKISMNYAKAKVLAVFNSRGTLTSIRQGWVMIWEVNVVTQLLLNMIIIGKATIPLDLTTTFKRNASWPMTNWLRTKTLVSLLCSLVFWSLLPTYLCFLILKTQPR